LAHLLFFFCCCCCTLDAAGVPPGYYLDVTASKLTKCPTSITGQTADTPPLVICYSAAAAAAYMMLQVFRLATS
jgi:hypothetical protein